MNNDKEDTVYTCFGMNGTPIPDGYHEDEFGFLFSEPVTGGGIRRITICDSTFTCLGSLHICDPKNTVPSYFNLPQDIPTGDVEWTLLNGAVLTYSGESKNTFSIYYRLNNLTADISVEDSVLHIVSMWRNS